MENLPGEREPKQKSTIPPFDILKVDRDGSILWIGTAESVEEAKERVRASMRTSPGEHIILKLSTGEKIVIKPETDPDR